MLLTLLRVRLASLFSSVGAGKSRRRSILLIVLLSVLGVYLLAVFLGLFALVFAMLAPLLAEAGAGHVYFGLAGAAAFLLMVLGSVIFTQNQLYAANDNELLLSMPIPPRLILLSRLFLLLFVNYLFEAVVALPALVVWLILGDASFLGMVTAVVGFLVLPVLALAVSCLLGYLVALISSRIRKKTLVTLLLSVLIFAAYFAMIFFMEGAFLELETLDVAPLIAFAESVWPIVALGRALSGHLLAFFLLLLLTAAIAAAVFWWLSRTFLSTVLARRGAARVAFREDTAKRKSALWALTVRELRHLVSSSGYMLNAGIGLLVALFPPIMLFFGGEVVEELGDVLSRLYAPFALSATAVCLSMVIFSACTVSLEGRSLWIVRTAPVPTRTVLLSKAIYHLILTTPVAVLATVLYAIRFSLALHEVILVILGLLSFLTFCAFFGLLMNLLFPKLEWKNELVPVKQGAAVLLTMLGGFVAAIVGALAVILLSLILPAFVALLLCTVFFAGLAAGMAALVLSVGVRRFESL